MNAIYAIQSGGIGDFLGQLNRFATICFIQGMEPRFGGLHSQRYKGVWSELVRQCFGELPQEFEYAQEMSLREFLNSIERISVMTGSGNVLVRGDASMAGALNSWIQKTREESPDIFTMASRKSTLFVQSLLKNGEIFERYQKVLLGRDVKDDSQMEISAHYRLGDLAVIRRSDFQGTQLESFFRKDYFSPEEAIGHVSKSEMMAVIRSKTPHLGARFERRVSPGAYLKAVDQLKLKYKNMGAKFTLCTDGYEFVANSISMSDFDIVKEDAEEILNDKYLTNLRNTFDDCVLGEGFSELMRTIDIALKADIMIKGSSIFPLSIRRLLGIKDPKLIHLEGDCDPHCFI